MKYLMLVCVVENVEPNADPTPWTEEMDGRGVRRRGNRLRPVRDSTTVRVKDGETLVADGPFGETKKQIGGFDILECADLDEAIAMASKHPAAAFGTLELRPFCGGRAPGTTS